MTMPRPSPSTTAKPAVHPDAGAHFELREQQHRDRDELCPHDWEHAVAAVLPHQPPAHDRGDEHTRHQRHELQARHGRCGALRDLQAEREVRDRAEEREADDEADCARDGERVVTEERERQDRLAARASTRTNSGEEHDARDDQADDLRRPPTPGVLAPEAREETHGRKRDGEERSARGIHRVSRVHLTRMERDGDDPERDRADRQVDGTRSSATRGCRRSSGRAAARRRSRCSTPHRSSPGTDPALAAG